jgi:phosphopentomutase
MGVSIANAKNRLPELIRAVEDEDVAIMLVDPENDVTHSSLQRAAAMVGRRVSIELV